MKNQYHQHCPRHSPSAQDESPLLPITKVLMMMASEMTLTTSRMVTTTRISATLTMVSKSPQRPLPQLHHQHRLYSPYHSYVASYANPLFHNPGPPY